MLHTVLLVMCHRTLLYGVGTLNNKYCYYYYYIRATAESYSVHSCCKMQTVILLGRYPVLFGRLTMNGCT